IAADGADLHRARIRWIEEAMCGGGFVDLLGDGSGLGAECEVSGVNLQNAVHLHGAENDRVVRRNAAAAQASAGSPGDDWRSRRRREFDALRNLLSGLRENDD